MAERTAEAFGAAGYYTACLNKIIWIKKAPHACYHGNQRGHMQVRVNR